MSDFKSKIPGAGIRFSDASHHDSPVRTMAAAAPTEKSFGVTFAVVFSLLAAWLVYDPGVGLASVLLIAAALAFLGAAYAAPALLRPFNWLWFKLGLLLHAIVSPLILGALYFLVVTPIGMAMRLSGKDFLGLSRTGQSYWLRRDPHQAGSMTNQF